jgi:outer membrane lipoprotein-sorting protein
MMKRISLLLFLAIFTLNMQGQDAKAIVKKADEKMQGLSNYAVMTIKIIRPTWQREMKMRSWSLGTKYSMIIIDEPKKDQGTVFLKRDKEIWNWIPSIDKSIKLPPSMMMQNWMGTDFTNDDLVKQSSIVVDYSHTITGDSTLQNLDCYKIELIPNDNAPVVWGKVILFIDKKDYMQLRTEFYDEDGYLVNLMNFYDVKEMGGRTIPTTMEMIPVDSPDKKTLMIYESIQFDIDISEDYFTTQKMKRVR